MGNLTREDVKMGSSHLYPERSASFISTMYFLWVNDILKLGKSRTLEVEDIYSIPSCDKSSTLGIGFEAKLIKARERHGDKYCVFWALLNVRFWKFLSLAGLKAIGESCEFVQPLLLANLLDYVSKPSDYPTYYPWLITAIITSCLLVNTIVMNYYINATILVGIARRTSCMSAVYRKALRVSFLNSGTDKLDFDVPTKYKDKSTESINSPSEKCKDKNINSPAKNINSPTATIGNMTNLMSIDCQKIRLASALFQNLWFQPVLVTICLIFLYRFLSYAAFLGFILMILFIFAQVILTKKMIRERSEMLQKTDKRVNTMHELIVGIRALKLLSWETTFSEKLTRLRSKELSKLRKLLYIRSYNFVLITACPVLAAAASFVVYVAVLDKDLNAATAFSSLALFNLLKKPLTMYPMVLNSVMDGWVSIKRIQSFLLLPDAQRHYFKRSSTLNEPFLCLNNCSFSWSIPKQTQKDEKKVKNMLKTDKQSYCSNTPNKLRNLPTTTIQKSESKENPENLKVLIESENILKKKVPLKNINFRLNSGQLACVVGRVGSFKSSLLSAILGEMHQVCGKVSYDGSMAYVSQKPFIVHGTVRDNILFGLPMNKKRYDEVIYSCALTPDIEMLPDGDMTEIGERGINLSGGQKARISLARAVFADADLYLIDDVLSSVDSHVAKHIVEKVLVGILKDKIRVIVLHQLQYLSLANLVLVMKNGIIQEQGSYDELLASGCKFSSVVDQKQQGRVVDKIVHYSTKESKVNDLDSSTDSENVEIVAKHDYHKSNIKTDSKYDETLKLFKTKNTLVQKEERSTGNVKKDYWLTLINAATMPRFSVLTIGFALTRSIQVFMDFWMYHWSNGDFSVNTGLIGYSSIAIVVVISSGFCAIFHIYLSLRISTVLNENLVNSLIKAPVSFYDATPTGRILNRCSNDISAIDETLPQEIASVFQEIMQLIAVAMTIAIVMPYFLVLLPFLCILYYKLQSTFRSSALDIKQSVTRSPLYNNFEETLQGAGIICAFGRKSLWTTKNDERTDTNAGWLMINFSLLRWLSIRLQSIGLFVVCFVACFVSYFYESLSPGQAGIVMLYALLLPRSLMNFIRKFSELELGMNSIERVTFYSTSIEQEALHLSNKKSLPNSFGKTSHVVPENCIIPPKEWPSRGEINIKDLCIRYRPELERTLKNVSVQIPAGCKVGIVGRTGSGKSTLMLALFRIMKEDFGFIEIDGFKLNNLPLQIVRSRISCVPQDPILFGGSVRTNLDPENLYTDQHLWDVLQKVQLEDTVRLKDNGLDAVVEGGGKTFSTGERQLLCLARAMLGNTKGSLEVRSKVLIMDEASAYVDVETDKLVQSMIQKEFKESTVIIVAHRLATIMHCDKVMVLDNGRLVQCGKPHSLLTSNSTSNPFLDLVNKSGPLIAERLKSLALAATVSQSV